MHSHTRTTGHSIPLRRAAFPVQETVVRKTPVVISELDRLVTNAGHTFEVERMQSSRILN